MVALMVGLRRLLHNNEGVKGGAGGGVVYDFDNAQQQEFAADAAVVRDK